MQDKITKCLGLVSVYNALTVAQGALRKARNCVSRRKDILEPRRGNRLYGTLASDVTQLLTYSNRLLVHRGTALEYDNGSGTFAAYSGSYSAPSGAKMRSLEAFSNLFTTTASGVQVFSNITGTAGRLAGAPRALDPSFSLSGSAGFLLNGNQCAYRATIVRTDTNANVITGYPSQRLWVTNTAGGARDVSLTMFLPQEARAGDVIQFYRTAQFVGTSDDISADEMGLIYQVELTSANITAGSITFTDSVVDELRGQTLYTSPSQEGLGQANERPPVCKDMTLYKSNYMLYANCQTPQRLFVTLVGAGSLTGKSVTLGGVTYNFGATEILSGVGSPQVRVSATGVAAVDIDLTARSFVRVINRFASNTTVNAFYDSGPSDLPGRIFLQEKGLGASAFTIQASDTAISGMFFPAPPVGTTNAKSTSTNAVQKNAVYFSKSQQPEHVPLLNYLFVGPSNKEILRIVALKDSAIVIKEEGIYRITGETPQSFSVVPVDLTVFCRAASSVAVLSNQVYMLSNQGIVAISESDVQVVSWDIEPEITPLLSLANISTLTFGCAYESERSYLLSTVSSSADTEPVQTLCYNTSTRVWSIHDFAYQAAIVESSSDRLFFSPPNSTEVLTERKTFSDADYADPEIAIEIEAINGAKIDIVANPAPQLGWVVEQGGTELVIESILNIPGGYRVTLVSTAPDSWTVGAATLYPSVGMEIEWHGWTFQQPDMLKQVRQVAILTDDLGSNSVSSLVATFRSNFDDELSEVTMQAPKAGWGSAWGTTPWGGGTDALGYPTYVPMNKQYCTRLNVGVKHRNAREKLSIAGLALSFEVASERIGR